MPSPTVLTEGFHYLPLPADGTTILDIEYVSDTGLWIYIEELIISHDRNLTANGNSGAWLAELQLDSVPTSRFFFGGKTDIAGTISGLTGLGTGTVAETQSAPADVRTIDLGGMPLPAAGTVLGLHSDITNGTAVFLTLVVRVGDAPPTSSPSVAVAGISGGQAIPVSASTAAPLVVIGKTGGTSLPVTVANITIETVTVNNPMPIKTSGTDTVKVIPG